MDDSLDFPGDKDETPVVPLDIEEVRAVFSNRKFSVTQGTGRLRENKKGIHIKVDIMTPSCYELLASKEGVRIGYRSYTPVDGGYDMDYTYIGTATNLHQAKRRIEIEENWGDTY